MGASFTHYMNWMPPRHLWELSSLQSSEKLPQGCGIYMQVYPNAQGWERLWVGTINEEYLTPNHSLSKQLPLSPPKGPSSDYVLNHGKWRALGFVCRLARRRESSWTWNPAQQHAPNPIPLMIVLVPSLRDHFLPIMQCRSTEIQVFIKRWTFRFFKLLITVNKSCKYHSYTFFFIIIKSLSRVCVCVCILCTHMNTCSQRPK